MQDQEIAREAESLSADARRLYCIRHSLAHIMAQAVIEIRPGAKLGFGPPVEHGFYYDFDLPEPIVAEELPKIEKRMREIMKRTKIDSCARRCPPTRRSRGSPAMDQPYKDEAVARPRGEGGRRSISFYTNGPFIDMCEGPHVRGSAGDPADAFKLDSIAGAYWRGDEKNKMLTRIYGLAFATKEELEDYIERRKIAQERDHRKLGRELDLFHIEEEIGKGLVLWLPNGTVLRDEIEKLAEGGGVPLRLSCASRRRTSRTRSSTSGAATCPTTRRACSRRCVSRRTGTGRGLLPQADELPAPPHDLPEPARAPTGTCRCASPSTGPATASRSRASWPGFCGCAASR